MKVLFLDSVHPCLEEILKQNGVTCDYDITSSKNIIEHKIDNYSGIIIRSRIPIDEKFLRKATQLKFIARSGAGMENIDVDFALSKKIKLFNSPEGNRDAVGEHAIGMLLMLMNQLKKADAEVRQLKWDREGNRGYEIAGKTIGIIGYGQMGSCFAKKLSGFGATILAFDKYKKKFGSNFVIESSLQQIQENAHIISFHVPLNDETKNYFNKEFIEKLEKPIYLINTSRGQIVKTEDLVEGLKSGKIKGACLDVLEHEKSSFELTAKKKLDASLSYLISSEKVILSPHVAGWTNESYYKLSKVLADKILSDHELFPNKNILK
jgi:D-3-phosphoglycerate dehydrogenase / 2-oxoglutarate reductase